MRKQALVVVSSLFFIAAFSACAEAKVYKRHAPPPPTSSPIWGWPYFPPVPEGAYAARVVYGPGNQRCVSQLVQLPNRWWRPIVTCE